jgi:hypothetical protein
MIPKDSSIKQQVAIVADIQTEGKNYCSIRCTYCKQNRVIIGKPYYTGWMYNYCLLFKEKLYGHNSKLYPKRRPKCREAVVQKTANDLSATYRIMFEVECKKGISKGAFNSFEGEVIRRLLETCKRSILPGEFKEDDVVFIRFGKTSDWPK